MIFPTHHSFIHRSSFFDDYLFLHGETGALLITFGKSALNAPSYYFSRIQFYIFQSQRFFANSSWYFGHLNLARRGVILPSLSRINFGFGHPQFRKLLLWFVRFILRGWSPNIHFPAKMVFIVFFFVRSSSSVQGDLGKQIFSFTYFRLSFSGECKSKSRWETFMADVNPWYYFRTVTLSTPQKPRLVPITAFFS